MGKTHTMQGSGNGEMRGIAPRAFELILNNAAEMQSNGWKITIEASCVEIYNESLRDQLFNNYDDRLAMAHNEPPQLSIKVSGRGIHFVDGITKVDINVSDQIKGMA